MNAVERWRPVVGFEKHYEVSDRGRMREITPDGSRRLIFLRTNNWGYRIVTLRPGSRQMLVHRAVLAAFIGPCPSGWHGCHRNQVKTDNRLENLRWDSPKGNAADTIHSGRHVSVIMRNRAEARKAVRSA